MFQCMLVIVLHWYTHVIIGVTDDPRFIFAVSAGPNGHTVYSISSWRPAGCTGVLGLSAGRPA